MGVLGVIGVIGVFGPGVVGVLGVVVGVLRVITACIGLPEMAAGAVARILSLSMAGCLDLGLLRGSAGWLSVSPEEDAEVADVAGERGLPWPPCDPDADFGIADRLHHAA